MPPSIRTIRQDIQQSVTTSGGQVIPALVGTAQPQSMAVSGLQFGLGSSTTFTIPGLGATGPIAAITQIRSQSSGGLIYTSGTDYTFNAGPQTIVWASVNLTPPYITAALVTYTGTLAAGTYYYVVTATKTLNITGPVVGETAGSNQIAATVQVGGGGSVALAWQQVPGAEGYNIYKSSSSGDFSGTSLLAIIAGGYTVSFIDNGSLSPSAGSPPGLASAGSVTSANSGPYVLSSGQTLAVKVNGAGALIATFSATQAVLSDGATYPVTLGASTTLLVKIDGGTTQTVTFAGTETTTANVAATIAAQLAGALISVVSGHVQIKSDRYGTGSSVNVTGGSANSVLLYSTSPVAGTGNVSNITAVTAAEVVTVLNAVINTGMTGATASLSVQKVTVTANTSGVLGSVQFDPGSTGGTANPALGFDLSLHSGSASSGSTALRRPALNGTSNTVPDKFYVDYTYTSTAFFIVQSFTSLTLALKTLGVGSNTAVGATLMMGTSGLGNNASQVLVMTVPDDTLATYQAAFNILGTRRDVDLVVPCNSAFNVSQSLQASVDFFSGVDQQRERIGIVGVPAGTSVGDTQTAGTVVYLANGMVDSRMMVVYPWPFVSVQQQDLSFVTTEMDGWASAAAFAGLMAALPDRAEPATTKVINGITALGGLELDETTMNILGGAGVTVLTYEDGDLIVRDSLTTQTVVDSDRHPSIILTEDLLRKLLRTNFKSFRGRKLLPNLLDQIQKRTIKVLNSLVKLQLIAGFNAQSVAAAQDPDNLTNIIVNFSYRPIFPVRTITFNYSFDLSPVTLAA